MKLFTKSKMNEYSEEVRTEILITIGAILVNGFDEKGNFAFTTETLSQTRLYKRIKDTDLLIEFSFANENYPAFNANVMQANDEEFKQFIRDELEGWEVKKCQYKDIKIGSDLCVASIEGYKVVNKDLDSFNNESIEIVNSFNEAKALLQIACENKPDEDWKITPIYEEDIE